MSYQITNWPLGEDETDGGSYPIVHTTNSGGAAFRMATDLIGDYAASYATISAALGEDRPDLNDYIEAAADLGEWWSNPRQRWELRTDRELVIIEAL